MSEKIIIPAIEVTKEQKSVIDSISDPFVRQTHDGDGSIYVQSIVDDSDVEVYKVQPNGDYIVDTLIGLNNGWEREDQDGKELPFD